MRSKSRISLFLRVIAVLYESAYLSVIGACFGKVKFSDDGHDVVIYGFVLHYTVQLLRRLAQQYLVNHLYQVAEFRDRAVGNVRCQVFDNSIAGQRFDKIVVVFHDISIFKRFHRNWLWDSSLPVHGTFAAVVPCRFPHRFDKSDLSLVPHTLVKRKFGPVL